MIDDERLRDNARAILRDNDRGGFTIPSARLYPHQWAWDSAFIAIGWSTFDLERGLRELESLFEGQWPDGRIPHIHFRSEGAYFPGPDVWRCPHPSSSITQPPVWATAALRLFRRGADRQRLRRLLPAIEASHRFYVTERDPQGRGCIAVAHPWESGRDNCPGFDPFFARVPEAPAEEIRRVDLRDAEKTAMRPKDSDYRRYIHLVRSIREAGFGLGAFTVYDPMMTSVLVRAELDLAALAEGLGASTEAAGRIPGLLRGLEMLWSEALGGYGFIDAHSDEAHTPLVLAGCAPLLVRDLLATDRRQALLRNLASLRTPYGLATTAPTDQAYEPKRYWRGPIWVNMGWLFETPPSFRETYVEQVRRTGFWEYFDPTTGEGLGAEAFSWTAALVLDALESEHSAATRKQ